MKEGLKTLIIDPQGTERIIKPRQTFEANPIITNETGISRPTQTTYKEALEWNKKSQEHQQEALNFVQEYAKRKVTPQYGNKIGVVSVADIHWGHKDVDYEFVDNMLDIIENTQDIYCVMGWNLLDAAIPSQFPDGVMWSSQTAQEQVYTFKDKINTLWRKNKILGAIGDCSCHEGWMKSKTGWMIYRELFGETDIPLLKNGGYLDIQVGDENYRTAIFHKDRYYSSLNKSHGGNRAMDRIVDAEIVFTSHHHLAEVSQSERFNPPFTKDTAVIASGTCKLKDGFARSNMGIEGQKGGQGIILWSDKHSFLPVGKTENMEEIILQQKRLHDIGLITRK